ncbi:hypothetical protein HDR58_03875 [bacterium]|nr:hypothetical protein [bacterium]
MKTDFLEQPITLKDIPKECPIDLCLLENNEKQIGQICDFLQSDEKLLLVNGYKGTGKTSVVDFVTSEVNSDVIMVRYNCLETTILDDMLLSFFDTFRNYTLQGKIITPKIKTENFTQKINSYFNTIDKPILIILHSFELVLKENKQEILSFIKHLMKLANVKIIITSRTFLAEDFENIEVARTTMLALSQALFEKYLKSNGIKHIGLLSNELYKHTKGYFNNVNLAVKIINLRGLTLVQFLEIYSKSFMSFQEFITREAISLIDPVSAHLFRLLAVMRIPIHVNLLKSLHLYDPQRVFFFVSNSLLAVDGECLYLSDTYREILERQIPENVMIKLHCSCVDLYNTQLPLKPLERDLRLSRQTMRNEIDYHSLFIPKKPQINRQDVRLVSTDTTVETPVPETVIEPTPVVEESKEEKINKISFIIEDENVLDGIADSINDFITEKVQRTEIEEQSENLTITQIINRAKQEEDKYNFKSVVLLYQNALTKKDDDNFYHFLPTIYMKLAAAYENLSQWYEALETYTQAQDYYFNISDIIKVSEIKLKVANIYYIIYKHDNAKYILEDLEKIKDLPNELKIQINMSLAKLTDNLNTEYIYYKKSIPLIEQTTDKTIVAELYYKFAGVNDEKNNTKSAVEYYKKCIETDPNPHHNKYLSTAFSNLAELYDEAGSQKHAIKYYNESMKIDTITKNYSGLYYCAIHLSEIYTPQDSDKALNYLLQAYKYAQQINEPFYIAGALLELGDFYLYKKDFEHAYKNFVEANSIAQISFSKENTAKIKSRIEEIKHRITEQEFNKLQEKYGK